MIGLGTLANVAAGSGLKIAGYVAGRIIDGYFEDKRHTTEALAAKAGAMVQLQSGDDTANDWSRLTRRVIAWMFAFTACFILAHFALNAGETVPILTDRDKGIFGWIFGGSNQTVVQVSRAQMIMNMWPLLELMFGFYFTKIGKN